MLGPVSTSTPAQSRVPASASPRLAWWRVLRALPRKTLRVARERWIGASVALAVGLLTAVVVSVFEHPWQELVLVARPGTALHIAANYASWWGKLENGAGVLVLGWLALGIARREHAAQAAVATLLWAQVVGGVLANLGKAGFGRSRPSNPAPDGFYGPSLDYAFQSFPSGHTTAAFTLGVTLAVLRPRWGVAIGIPYAVVVGWSRLAIHVHHPSDVIMGAVLGSVVGLVCGEAGRRLGARPGRHLKTN